jgi:hypothetical protein
MRSLVEAVIVWTRYAYTWGDGVYLDAGLEKEKTTSCVLWEQGGRVERSCWGWSSGYRESKERWAEVLRDLRNRGLEAPITATDPVVSHEGNAAYTQVERTI